MNILILVDSAENIEYLNPVLANKSYTCTIVDNVFSGLYAIKKENFDVVITELSIEDLSGLVVAEYVTQNKPQTSVVICNNKQEKITHPELLNLDTVYTVTKDNCGTITGTLMQIEEAATVEIGWEKVVF